MSFTVQSVVEIDGDVTKLNQKFNQSITSQAAAQKKIDHWGVSANTRMTLIFYGIRTLASILKRAGISQEFAMGLEYVSQGIEIARLQARAVSAFAEGNFYLGGVLQGLVVERTIALGQIVAIRERQRAQNEDNKRFQMMVDSYKPTQFYGWGF